jgi:NADH-quinone oxidoreductase subunit A
MPAVLPPLLNGRLFTEYRSAERMIMVSGLAAYTPILIIMALAMVLAFTLTGVSIAFGPKRPSAAKLAPYECGIVPTTPARQRFPVKFYLMAMLFIVFDIEAIFLYPWAVWLKHLKVFGFEEMLVFIGVLFLGLLYIWRKGVLEWD